VSRRAPARGHAERTVGALLAGLERAQRAEREAGGRGLLQRVDPRVKVAGVLSLVLAVVLARNAGTIAALLALGVAAALASRIRLSSLAAGIWAEALVFTGAIALPALFVTPGPPAFHVPLLPWPVTAPGLASAAYLLLRVEAAATLAWLLVATTPWPHVLKALRVLRVPMVAVAVLGMTYRYILLLLESARDMFEAHRARAVSRPRNAAAARQAIGSAGMLLSKSLGLGGDVYMAMQARGFRGEVHVLDDFRMAARDWLALASFAALTAGAVWAGR
jgi:cobalt/nickel transport system permease protein